MIHDLFLLIIIPKKKKLGIARTSKEGQTQVGVHLLLSAEILHSAFQLAKLVTPTPAGRGFSSAEANAYGRPAGSWVSEEKYNNHFPSITDKV